MAVEKGESFEDVADRIVRMCDRSAGGGGGGGSDRGGGRSPGRVLGGLGKKLSNFGRKGK